MKMRQWNLSASAVFLLGMGEHIYLFHNVYMYRHELYPVPIYKICKIIMKYLAELWFIKQ